MSESAKLQVGDWVRINKPGSLYHDFPAEIIHFFILGKPEPRRVLLRLNSGSVRSEWLADLVPASEPVNEVFM